MTAELTTAPAGAVSYAITQEQIEAARVKYAELTCTDPDGYEQVRAAIGELRGMRTSIEKRRKELNSDALAWQRRVNNAAQVLTELIEGIENPLKLKKLAVDQAAALARQAEFDRIQREHEEKLKQERAAEAARIAQERAKLEASRLAQKQEQDRLDAERRKLDADRQRIDDERQQLDRQKAIRAEMSARRARQGTSAAIAVSEQPITAPTPAAPIARDPATPADPEPVRVCPACGRPL